MVRLLLPPGSGKQVAGPRARRRGRPRRRRGPHRDGAGVTVAVLVLIESASRRALPAGRRLRPRRPAGRRRGGRRSVADGVPYAPAAWAQALVEQIAARAAPAVVLAPGSDGGNEVLAHVAANLDLPMAANCTALTPGDAGDRHARPLGRQPARGGARPRLAAAADRRRRTRSRPSRSRSKPSSSLPDARWRPSRSASGP